MIVEQQMAKLKDLRKGYIVVYKNDFYHDCYEVLDNPVFAVNQWSVNLRSLDDPKFVKEAVCGPGFYERDIFQVIPKADLNAFLRNNKTMKPETTSPILPLLVVGNEVRPMMAATIAAGMSNVRSLSLDSERDAIVGLSVSLADKILAKCGVAVYGADDSVSTAAESSVVVERDALREVAQKFCDRVESGEVRSRRTYAAFKEILTKYAGEEEITD